VTESTADAGRVPVSVERRVRNGKVRWYARWVEDGRWRSRTFDRKRDAVSFDDAQRRRGQLGAHTPAAPSGERLTDWLRVWWEREAAAWAASTRYQRGALLDRWVVPFLGPARLRDLGSATVRDWRGMIGREGAPPNTQNAALSVLSAALGAAARDGLLPANPCAGVRKLPHLVARPRALTPAEVERIRVELPRLRDVALWGLLAYAGLRPEGALALRWRDVGRALVVDEAFTYGEAEGHEDPPAAHGRGHPRAGG
jgi:integrase